MNVPDVSQNLTTGVDFMAVISSRPLEGVSEREPLVPLRVWPQLVPQPQVWLLLPPRPGPQLRVPPLRVLQEASA